MSDASVGAPPRNRKGYLTGPDPSFEGWPPGVPYIIGNEGCERFSFYGMKSILQVHMTVLGVMVLLTQGMADGTVEWVQTTLGRIPLLTPEGYENAAKEAQYVVHLFIAGVYAFPMIGAILADRLWNKYNTILWLSLVYCAGHAVLAFGEDSLTGMYLGLGLIAIGSGGIKPCVSANVGDQFGKANWSRLERVFQAFYFIINFGSFFATLLIPWVKEAYGTSVAFGIPGVLMFIATVVFWSGRKKFVHVPARPGGSLGALDFLSSTFLFMTFGSLFFTATGPLWVILLASASSLLIGIALFFARQQRQPDDSFLPVFLYAFANFIRGGRGEGRPVRAAGDDKPASERWLDTSKFWGAAVRRYGHVTVEGPVAVLKIISIFLMVSVFWALFDQHASSWIRQAQVMDRTFDLPLIGAFTVLPSQVQALNPALVMILIPFAGFVIYPGLGRLGFKMTPLRRMTVGMCIASAAFAVVALIQARIDGGEHVHVVWQIIPYLIMTLAEVMVSITGLEFAYSQAPRRMKSTVMGFWLLTVALGNVLVSFLSTFKGLALVDFFWTFSGFMAVAAVLFGVRAAFYRMRDYAQ